MSPISPNATIYVPEKGLPTPRNLRTGQMNTNTSITLKWDYPPPPVEIIESFIVTYSGNVEWRSPDGTLVQFEDSGELTVTGTTVTISPLIPGTSYHFKVSVVTSKGRGAEDSLFLSTQMYQDKLAYFQLRMSPVYSCLEYSNPGLNYIDKFRSALVEEINSQVCTECQLTEDNIRNHEFSCRGGLTNQIVYRAMIIGTDVYSAPALVSRIQSWVATGSASITVLSTRLHLDKSCNASLDTLAEPDCFQLVETVKTTTLQAVTTVTKATVKTTIPTSEEEGPSVKDTQVSRHIRVGDIFAFLFGVTTMSLLVVLVIVIIVVAVKKFRPKPIKSEMAIHNQMFDASLSDIGSNRESINLDDEHTTKEDLAK